jgi:hypothetical protein
VMADTLAFANILGLPIWKGVAYFMITTLALLPWLFAGIGIFGSPSSEEVLTLICILCMLAIAALIEHFYITESENSARHMNNLIEFNRKFRKTNLCNQHVIILNTQHL